MPLLRSTGSRGEDDLVLADRPHRLCPGIGLDPVGDRRNCRHGVSAAECLASVHPRQLRRGSHGRRPRRPARRCRPLSSPRGSIHLLGTAFPGSATGPSDLTRPGAWCVGRRHALSVVQGAALRAGNPLLGTLTVAVTTRLDKGVRASRASPRLLGATSSGTRTLPLPWPSKPTSMATRLRSWSKATVASPFAAAATRGSSAVAPARGRACGASRKWLQPPHQTDPHTRAPPTPPHTPHAAPWAGARSPAPTPPPSPPPALPRPPRGHDPHPGTRTQTPLDLPRLGHHGPPGRHTGHLHSSTRPSNRWHAQRRDTQRSRCRRVETMRVRQALTRSAPGRFAGAAHQDVSQAQPPGGGRQGMRTRRPQTAGRTRAGRSPDHVPAATRSSDPTRSRRSPSALDCRWPPRPCR